MTDYLLNFAALFTESAPWLLLGLLIAGFMKWIVPLGLLEKHMGDNRVISIVKAAFIGAPLPLCSCGVIPAAIGLRRSGASKSTTVSFLVATPETGVDSISVSYALLGPFFAIIRPVSAIFTAIYAGIMVKLFAIKEGDITVSTPNSHLEDTNDKTSSCCSETGKMQEVAKSCCENSANEDKIEKKSSCCSTDEKPEKEQETSLFELIKHSLAYSSGKLLSDLTKWLLIGLLLAAAIKTWVSTDFLLQWGSGFTAMLVMAVVGIPMYICATASTPLAAGFLAAGLSPGAILVFMLAGPATNIATMGMIRKELGTPVLLAYLFSLFSASISIGYLTNWLIESYHFTVRSVATISDAAETSLLFQLAAILLAALMLRNGLKTFSSRS